MILFAHKLLVSALFFTNDERLWRLKMSTPSSFSLLLCAIAPPCGQREERISTPEQSDSDRAASNTFIKYKRRLCSAVMLKYLEN